MSNNQNFLDVLSIISFAIGLANYEENVDQSAMSETVNAAVEDIHQHLNEQDVKLSKIMEKLEVTE